MSQAETIALVVLAELSDAEPGDEEAEHEAVRRGVAKALAGIATPFVLTPKEQAARDFFNNPKAPPESLSVAIVAAIDRAVRTLGAQAGGEWIEADYLTAEAALDHERRRGVKTEKSCHAAKVALDAVKHRITGPAVDPLADADASLLNRMEMELDELRDLYIESQERLREFEKAPKLEPLSERERSAVDRWAGREPHQHSQAECDAAVMACALASRFPKPAPVVKTPGQVLCEAQQGNWEHADRELFERQAAAVLIAHGAKP